MRFVVVFADDVSFSEAYETIQELTKVLSEKEKDYFIRDIHIEAI